jgi:hypothetical protein
MNRIDSINLTWIEARLTMFGDAFEHAICLAERFDARIFVHEAFLSRLVSQRTASDNIVFT